MHGQVAITSAAPPRSSGAARGVLSWSGSAWPLVVAAGATIATAYVATHDPNVPGALGTCPLYAATGLYCPGCGGMRATYFLAHGDIVSAMGMNPLLTVLAPLFGVLWLRWFLRTRGRTLKPWPFPTAMGVLIPVVIAAFFILRNTPALAPYLAP